MYNYKTPSILVGAALAIASTSTVAADAPSEGTLEEIVVTAERREQSLQETPLTVNVVTGEEISKTGISTFDDVLQKSPGAQMQAGPAPNSGPTISIRGIGTDGPNKKPGTAIYADGVASYFLDSYFYDLARVEVLSGPQGTLYGGTATGGAVNIISNNPNLEEFAGSAQLERGNHDLMHATAMINAPATDTLGFRLGANYIKRDQYSGGGDDGMDTLHARGKMLWEPSDAFSLLVGFEYLSDEGLSRDSERLKANGDLTETRQVQLGFNDVEVKKYFANVNADLGFAQLTYIPAMQEASLDRLYTTNFPGQAGSMPEGKFQSHELRFSSEPDAFVTWVVGGYYYHEESVTTANILLGGPQIVVVDGVDSTELAGFGQATIPLSDSWRLTGGVRVNEDHVKHPQTSDYPALPPTFVDPPPQFVPFDKTYHRFDYLARLEHDLTEDNLVYGSVSTGYRPGGLSVAGGAYDNETVKAFEVGSKNTLLDGSLAVNGAMFYYKYSGFQLASAVVCGPGCFVFDVVSVPAEIKGAELDVSYRFTPNDTVSLQPSYLDGAFTGNVLARATTADALSLVQTDGEDLPHAANWRLNAGYQHDFRFSNGGSLFTRGEVAYVSEQVTEFSACAYSTTLCATDNRANHTQEAFTLVNLSTGYTAADDRWSVTGYVRNLTDEHYKVFYTDPVAFVGAPRTYGLIFAMNW